MIPKQLIEEANRQIDGTYNVQYDPVIAQNVTRTAKAVMRELLVKTGMSDDQHLLLESLEISRLRFNDLESLKGQVQLTFLWTPCVAPKERSFKGKTMKLFKWLLIALLLSSATVFAGQPIKLSNAEKRCMKTALYHESRGEPDRGMFAVASVILSRLNDDRFPGEDVCEIVYQKGQFTFDKKKKMTEPDAIAKAAGVIDAIESGFMTHMPFLYFHNVNVKGMCTNNKKRVRIGNHYFC